ncbi:hypothetical protein GSM98_02830 [Rhodococcus rhodochrous]|nr:hypothetical protein [Rhodococcus rhodochrous]
MGKPVVSMAEGSRLTVGARSVLVSASQETALGVNHPVVLRTLRPSAEIAIGEDVGISGASICAATSITIGDGTLLGANVSIVDTDFHPIESAARRYSSMPDPSEHDKVTIGPNVFIGTNTIVLKGSSIGEGSVVGAGSVIKGKFPPRSIIAGNPARVIRQFSVGDSTAHEHRVDQVGER